MHRLKHGDPQQVLSSLRELIKELEATGRADTEAFKTLKGSLEYLEKRQEQIRYAEFQAMGYPIGSGAVESANKLVVEARLKGSGMHWARAHVNPMVALRTMICSDRWEEAWPQITRRRREQTRKHTGARAGEPSSAQNPQARSALVQGNPKPSLMRPTKMTPTNAEPELPQPPKTPADRPRRPAANHPWRRMSIGRTGSPIPAPVPGAKI